MKLSPRTPYNIAFVFLMLTALWGMVSFFSYHIAPLPERMPQPLLNALEAAARPGERIYLADQRFDQFVGSHPQFNIFPGSGKNASIAAADTQFFLIGGTSLRSDFAALEGFDRREVAFADGVTLWRFDKRGAQFAEYRLSDSFPDGASVRSSLYPDGSPLKDRAFITGRDPWQNIQVSGAEFGKKHRTALTAHPLHGADQWIELTVDPAQWKAPRISFEYGVADSGDCKGGCQPVRITITQDEKNIRLESKDALWQEAPLDGFAADRPFTVRIVAPHAGKRHFFCDVLFRAPVAGGGQ
ncbi:MAG TPA: hypothetical protein PLV42_00570 [bacterium]|nr:hypothetical protein [bacterium]